MKEQIETYLDRISNYVTNEDDTYYAIPGGYSDDRLAREISELDFWQPIETAPIDGTWVQGWAEGKYLGNITYYSHYGIWVTDVYNVFDSEVFPTKWQPIPNPPKQ